MGAKLKIRIQKKDENNLQKNNNQTLLIANMNEK